MGRAGASRYVCIVVVLMNRRNDGRCIDKRIAKLPASEENIVVPSGSSDSKRWQVDQFTVSRKYEIIDRIVAIKLSVIMYEQLQIFSPFRVGKIPRFSDVNVPSSTNDQKVSLAN